MKFPEFDYARPTNLTEALDALRRDESRPLAGGQSLLPLMAFRLSRPELIVDLNQVQGLDSIQVDERDRTVEIGAMTTHSAVLGSPQLFAAASIFRRTARQIGHHAIRNRGTVGGSVAHADPSAEWPALLSCLDATIALRSASGERRVGVRTFVEGPYMTSVRPGELLTALSVDLRPVRAVGFYEVARRTGDFALAGAFGAVRGSSTTADIVVTCFGVAGKPMTATYQGRWGAAKEDPYAFAETVVAEMCEDTTFSNDLHGSEAVRRHLAVQCVARAIDDAARQIGG